MRTLFTHLRQTLQFWRRSWDGGDHWDPTGISPVERIAHSFHGAHTVLLVGKWSAQGQAHSRVTERYRWGTLHDPQEPRGAHTAEVKDIRPDREDPCGLFWAPKTGYRREVQVPPKNQHPDKSVAEFVAKLRRLTRDCKFKDHLDKAMRDRFVCGI